MKPVDRRKFLSALHRNGKARGVEIIEDPDAGSGSHGSLLFRDESGCKPLRIVIVYAREISPGVQRAILDLVRARSIAASLSDKERALAASVFELLKECFAR